MLEQEKDKGNLGKIIKEEKWTILVNKKVQIITSFSKCNYFI